MSILSLRNISKQFGSFSAVNDVNLTIPNGTFVCLLGPSGCGKTTLLRLIAGLEEPTSGSIIMGDKDITYLPTHKRGLGMVFQSLALFPHLTVGENIAYPLRIRNVKRTEIRQQVDRLLLLVHLEGFADRSISQLSGGQRQRVAIARSLAISPRLFLLDEPLSALDAKLREAMQIELKQLQRQIGITTIVVTHDQREAMTMADKVVVMNKGKILQVGSPVEVYRQPADTFVADFIGTTNLQKYTVKNGQVIFSGGVTTGLKSRSDLKEGFEEGFVSIRPEDVRLVSPSDSSLSGEVNFIRDLGEVVEIYIDCKGQQIIAAISSRQGTLLSVGQKVGVSFSQESVVFLEK